MTTKLDYRLVGAVQRICSYAVIRSCSPRVISAAQTHSMLALYHFFLGPAAADLAEIDALRQGTDTKAAAATGRSDNATATID
jgi:hypothetical protein